MKTVSIFKFTTIVLLVIGFFTVNINASGQSQPEKNKAEVDAIITQVGSISPEWWDSTELTYPETLDMNWPVQQGIWQGRGGMRGRGERGRRGQRGESGAGMEIPTNIDQYLMQIVYPNPSEHKQGIKLVYRLLNMHKDDKQKLSRDMNTLGYMFYDLLMDHARAAYWLQKSAEAGAVIDEIKIARCYFELGSKDAAEEILMQIENSSSSKNSRDIIKLWATIGEVDKALEMVKSYSVQTRGRGGFNRGNNPQLARDMLTAEICRQAGRYDQAIEYYQKVADAQPDNQNNQRPQGRGGEGLNLQIQAKANIEAIKIFRTLDLDKVSNGSYTGSGRGHEGNVTVKVVINGGKIESVEVTEQRETPDRFVMAEQVTRKITSKQGIQGVDVITGATETSDAIINTVAEALVSAIE